MLKEYSQRLTICISGLVLYALGNFFGVLAGSAGTNGWSTMALGLSNTTGMSFGTGAGPREVVNEDLLDTWRRVRGVR